MGQLLVGIDTGGTFTDFVYLTPDGLQVHKVPSTPRDPSEAVLAGLSEVAPERGASVVHGSTVATNALLERRGTRTALVTTRGFEDVIEIGRQSRPRIYDLAVQKVPPLVPRELRIGLKERVGPDGEVIEALASEEIEGLAERLTELGAASVAVCFLHAYANPDHEAAVLRALEGRWEGFRSASHEVLREFREYERCSTTVVNAYVGPVMAGYLDRLADDLQSSDVRIMQSNGGTISLATAQRHAVQTVLSGPAGGAVGAFALACRAGYENVITFDMGGTSTDVCLCPGFLSRTPEAGIGEIPIRLPVIDIHTVGAGGGSIAYRDEGGSLRVGPRSAGAEPGPIAYGRGGTEVTVTDANLALGRLPADHFLGGAQPLDVESAQAGVDRLAGELGMPRREAAEGVIRVANATMERAIRVISLERGHDPRDFTLVCFGGAGAMHAVDLASALGIPRILVPQAAGTLSALGMLLADYVRDYSRTLLVPSAELDHGAQAAAFERLEDRARADAGREGLSIDDLGLQRSLDLRYRGQGYELNVPHGDDFEQAFHTAHEQRFGYADPGRATEVVNVRVRATIDAVPIELPEEEPAGEDANHASLGEHGVVIDGEELTAMLVDRDLLRPGNAFEGPAIVVEYSTTTVVPPGFNCRVDRWFNLVLEPTRGPGKKLPQATANANAARAEGPQEAGR